MLAALHLVGIAADPCRFSKPSQRWNLPNENRGQMINLRQTSTNRRHQSTIVVEDAKLEATTATRGKNMANQININRPSTRVVIASAIVALLALIGHFSNAQFLTDYQFALAMISYLVLLIGVLFKGL